VCSRVYGGLKRTRTEAAVPFRVTTEVIVLVASLVQKPSDMILTCTDDVITFDCGITLLEGVADVINTLS